MFFLIVLVFCAVLVVCASVILVTLPRIEKALQRRAGVSPADAPPFRG